MFQQFALAASVTLGLTMVFVGAWISSRILEGALHSSAGAGALYMASFLEPHVQSLESETSLSADEIAQIDRIAANFALRRHVLSIKIWKPDGVIAYSSEKKSQIGRRYQSDEIEPSLRGEITASFARLDSADNDFERSLSLPLYEVFTPLYKTGSGKIIAVGEFYENADALVKESRTAVQNSWFVVGGAAVLMLMVLFGIVYRGSSTIERQKAELRRRLQEQASLNQSNRRLHGRIQEAMQGAARTDERIMRRIGAELHDGPAQLIAFVLLRLDEMRHALHAAGISARETAAVEAIRHAATDALDSLRSISVGLLMAELDTSDDAADVVRRVIRLHEQRTHSTVRFACRGPVSGLPREVIRCIGRVTQEALTNAAKHAGAARQEVLLDVDQGAVHLRIRDGGPGFSRGPSPAAGPSERLGLVGMRYRVDAVGGTLEVRSVVGGGTEIAVMIPLEPSPSIAPAPP